MSWLHKISGYEDTWEVRQHGSLKARGSEAECYHYIHNHVSSSWDAAKKYDGWTVTRSGTDWRDDYEFYHEDVPEQKLDPDRPFDFFCRECDYQVKITPKQWQHEGHPICPHCKERLDVNT
jgi:hypothetical protein